ncbi:GNAT family N-acetyltransferase [Mycolicibacterium bacteremicum]|uniref:GNAT family N-acetyltransferase n=1 Tax=Mycolicibacterium bacteremicum TaxID=564198 RepID=UPI0026EA7B83|nr:N-acetyltransferase [Mycolicibacterium bacteremicum]
MIVRRETADDIGAISAVTAAAFSEAARNAPPVEPGEVTLISWLRADPGWIPELSLVGVDDDGNIIGHVVATRGDVDGAPALGLGPLSVAPQQQGSGVGAGLMHTVLGAADALGESLVCLLGEPGYYRRFGFVPAATTGVMAPDPLWGDYFQIRTLTAYEGQAGRFRYAAPFTRV